MKTPFKLRSGNASSFKNLGSSPVKQEEFIKTNIAGQRVNMMGVPHGTPKSKLTDIGSLKPEHKGLYKQKGTMPKGFNVKGSSAAGTKILTKQEKAAKYKKTFDKFQSQKQKGKQFVKGLKKAGKVVGGKTLGVLGMLSSTLSHADQPKKRKGSYTSDITKMKGYKK